jgi:hypothetical protein
MSGIIHDEMSRMIHGQAPSLESLREMQERISSMNRDSGLPFSLALVRPSWPFGYLFDKLQLDPLKLLPTSPKTVLDLRRLGKSMIEASVEGTPGVPVPPIYTFFGQFIDHDITLEAISNSLRKLSDPDLEPISPLEISEKIANYQSPNLDLATVYGRNARIVGKEMKLDNVIRSRNGIPKSAVGLDHDLPRGPRSSDPKKDRVALIGDTRNDENLVIAQLHVAFLRAHNVLVREGKSFEQARKLLRQHYQWIVLDDFLYRVADPEIVDDVRKSGPRFFNPPAESFFIPLEFSVAAFRFGHSKIRPAYDYNNLVGSASIRQLFFFTMNSGNLATKDNLTSDWIIDWKKFVRPDESNFSRPIDTRLSNPLDELKQEGGADMDQEVNLAIRNLLRGYILRMPTGQAVAETMGFTPLTDKQIKAIPSVADTPEQLAVLKEGDFLTRTPLWFYILAEAAHYDCKAEHNCVKGQHLGAVGSTIVAEVLYGILLNSTDSILSDPDWKPTLKGEEPGKFKLPDLLRLARVL